MSNPIFTDTRVHGGEREVVGWSGMVRKESAAVTATQKDLLTVLRQGAKIAVEDCFAASPKPTGRPGAKSDSTNQRARCLLSARLADALEPEVSMHNRVEIDRSAEYQVFRFTTLASRYCTESIQ
jgi:hypothetical protein